MTYDQTKGVVLNLPVGIIGKSVDMRSQMPDAGAFRDYVSTAEALAQLTGVSPAHTDQIRTGHFPVYVTPVPSGPTTEYWFDQGSLVKKVVPAAPSYGSEAVNIKSLGVVGDGSDESLAFKAAIVTAAGRTLVIENISISMKAVIISGGPKIDIRGNGVLKMLPESTLTSNGTFYQDRFIYIGSVNGVRITGLEIDMQHAPGNETSGTTTVYLDTCTNIYVEGTYVHDNGHAGWMATSCHQVTFFCNHVENTDSGIFVAGDSDYIKLIANTVHGGTSEGVGIFSSGPTTNYPSTWEITGNIIYNKAGFAINCCAAFGGIISGNIVTDCLGLVTLYDSGSGNPATRHSIFNLVTGNRARACSYGVNNVGNGSTITGNHFQSITYFAIGTNNYTDNTGTSDLTITTFASITNNHFYSCGGGSGPAVWLYNIQDSVFAGNQFHRCSLSYQGLKLEKCSNLDIRGNNGATLNLTAVAGTDYSQKMLFSGNTFNTAYITPTVPAGVWNWEFENTRFAGFDLDPANAAYDIVPVSGVADVNAGYIREEYRVTTGGNITSIAASWNRRKIRLTAKPGVSFTIVRGGNITLGNTSRVPADGAGICLSYDQITGKWREQYLMF